MACQSSSQSELATKADIESLHKDTQTNIAGLKTYIEATINAQTRWLDSGTHQAATITTGEHINI